MKFFKYVTAETAKIVLESGRRRWTRPLRFNDPFDNQFDLHVEFNEATIVDLVLNGMWEFYLRLQKREPINFFGQVVIPPEDVAELSRDKLFGHEALRTNIRDASQKLKAEAPSMQKQLRAILNNSLVFCVSEVHDNILMWSHYAQDHTGAVLEFDTDKDIFSTLRRAEKVEYSKTMPRFMTEQDVIRFFSFQWQLNAKEHFHRSVFTKAADWSYEKEWRVWLPVGDPLGWSDPNYVLPLEQFGFIDQEYKREELVGIYLGCRMSQDNVGTLRDLVLKLFPHASLHRATKSAREFALQFEPLP